MAFVFWPNIYIYDPQRVQTVQSWLTQAISSFVDAKVADHILAWAQATLKSAVWKNLEEPDKHFQSYGDVFLVFFLTYISRNIPIARESWLR